MFHNVNLWMRFPLLSQIERVRRHGIPLVLQDQPRQLRLGNRDLFCFRSLYGKLLCFSCLRLTSSQHKIMSSLSLCCVGFKQSFIYVIIAVNGLNVFQIVEVVN